MNEYAHRPESEIDLFRDAALLDPWPLYRRLHDQAGAVWLPAADAYALSRYEDVRAALGDWEVFSSAGGTSLTPAVNRQIAGNTLGSDPPLHDRLRVVLNRPLAPPLIRGLTGRLQDEADQLVDELVRRVVNNTLR